MEGLEGFVFALPSKPKEALRLSLTELGLSFVGENRERVSEVDAIRFADVLGCTCHKELQSDRSAYLSIKYYPRIPSRLGKTLCRRRTVLDVSLSIHDSPLKNLDQLKGVESLILEKAFPNGTTNNGPSGTLRPFPKPLLVLLNPKSGKHLAVKLFKEKFLPMLTEANADYVLLETEHAGHGQLIATEVDLNKYYGIVIVSGDGLLHEVYQGLMSRADWRSAVRTPIGVLPAGSGNALSCSINSEAGEPYQKDLALHAAYVLLKHEVTPMDLVALQMQDGRRVYSFLSVTWGYFADVDIESERFRKLGNARFTVGGILRIINLRTYKGRISFKPLQPYKRLNRSKSERADTAKVVDDVDRQRSHSAPPEPLAPDCHTDESQQDTEKLEVPSESGTESIANNADQCNQDASNPEHAAFCSSDISNAKSNQDCVIPPGEDDCAFVEIASDPGTEIPPIGEPVPSDWVTIEDEFISFSAVYQKLLGPDLKMAPDSRLNDGLIHLLLIRAPISKAQLLSIALSMEDGSHIKNPSVELIETVAFRLVPLTYPGHLAVDGENVTYGPIQGYIMPKVARVMAKCTQKRAEV